MGTLIHYGVNTMLDQNLVFEGIDRVGKSTLIKELQGYHHIKMIAPSTIYRTFYEYLIYFCKINGTIKQLDKPICFDRGHLSELVYGRLYRPAYYTDGILIDWIMKMEARLVQAIATHISIRPTCVVYVEPSNFVLMLNDERPNANRLTELAVYEQVLKKTKLPVVRITTQTANWKKPSIVINELKELLNG